MHTLSKWILRHARILGQDKRVLAAALTSATALFQKVAGLIFVMVSMPVAHDSLGTNVFAIWIAATSYMSIASFLDFGVGNGVVNAVSRANAEGDLASCRLIIGAAVALMTISGIVIAVIGVGTLILCLSSLIRVNLDPSEARQMAELGGVLIAAFALNVPLSSISRAQYALQKGYQINALYAISQLACSGGLLAASGHANMRFYFYLALCGWPLLANVANVIMVALGGDRRLWPSFSGVRRETFLGLLKSGARFVVFQVALSIVLLSDNILVGAILGASALAKYAAVARLYSAVGSISGLLIMPYWPALREATVQGDHKWARRMLRRALAVVALVGGTVVVAIAAFGKDLLVLWMGPGFAVSQALIVGMGLWTLVFLIESPVSIYLNAMDNITAQALCMVVCAACMMVVKIIALPFLGVSSVGWLNACIFAVAVVLPLGAVMWHQLQSSDRNQGRKMRTGAIA